MKKLLTAILGTVCAASLCLTVFTACGDDGNGDGSQNTPETYSITTQSGTGYTLSADKTEAEEGETVTVTATVTDPSTYLTGVYYNSSACVFSGGVVYTFTMPAEDVTVTANAETYTEVLSNGGMTFRSSNAKSISVNSGNGGAWVGSDWVEELWTFDIDLNWGSNTTGVSERNSYVTSSNEAVIPESAITYEMDDRIGTSNTYRSINVTIDTTAIAPGTTWLTMHFQSYNSSSNRGTICVQITVTPEDTVVQLEKWTETVVFDLQSGIDTDTLYFQFKDNNYASNTDAKEYQYFEPGDYEVENGEVTLTIEYVAGHEYSIYVGITGTGDTLVLGDSYVNGGSYANDILTFEREGVTIDVYVYNELWRA